MSVTVVQNFLNDRIKVITVLMSKHIQKVGYFFVSAPVSCFVLGFALGGIAGRALGLQLVCIGRLELRFALPSIWDCFDDQRKEKNLGIHAKHINVKGRRNQTCLGQLHIGSRNPSPPQHL